ncbi:serine hydrolase [Dyadobacter sandarakinus]|uniref:serine hydrolase n=1 Tax=Dyadobacter sandarakinus TaxID=2747268 RepID=UPI001E42F7C3|nr:serine hydrolase [Dyadobacter sandarakinus]
MSLQLFAYPSPAQSQTDHFLERLLKKYPERFTNVLSQPEKYKVQVLYTRIDRNRKNEPHFTTHSYGVNSTDYFYPASTVKLPAIILAFEKLNRLGIDKYTPMFTGTARPEQTAVTRDTTSEDGLPSVAHYAKKILLASDNDAFNRLYEFIGQEEFNEGLKKHGYTQARITHRLDLNIGTENNRYTNPVKFVKDGKVVYEQPAAYCSKVYTAHAPIPLGKGFVKNGKLVEEPFDFAEKNYFPLEEQHRLLRSIFFPEQVVPAERFNLTPEDYRFLYQYMSQFPVETSFPANYTDDYYDGYVKFLLFGSTKTRLPRHIRLFNKSGDAYGFLLDNAYIADFEKGIELMVTAVIYCNEDGIFNDDKYEYETVGFPFMVNLGKTLFEYELSRKHTNRPDLSRFEVEYDK